jgi:hypothetical protein
VPLQAQLLLQLLGIWVSRLIGPPVRAGIRALRVQLGTFSAINELASGRVPGYGFPSFA